MAKELPDEVVQLVHLLETATKWLKTRTFTKDMLNNTDRRLFVEKLQGIIEATQSLKYL